MPEPLVPEAIAEKQITPMLAYWDKFLVCRFANDAYLQWFGKHRRDMVNKITLLELLGPQLFHLNLPYIENALKGKPQTFEREIPVLFGNGTRYSHAIYFPNIADGDVKGFFVHVADITKKRFLQLENRAADDQTIKEQHNKPVTTPNIVSHDLKTAADTRGIIIDMFNTVGADSNKVTDFLEIILSSGHTGANQ